MRHITQPTAPVELDVRGSFERRSFVDWILGAGITGTAVSFLYPVLKFVIPPPVAEAIDLNVVAAAVEELPPNAAKIL